MMDSIKTPHKITATLKVVITGEFFDDETTEETLRYCVEQDLEDAGFDVDVSVMHNNRIPFTANSNTQWT